MIDKTKGNTLHCKVLPFTVLNDTFYLTNRYLLHNERQRFAEQGATTYLSTNYS